jgi:hypothetical protein
MPNGKPGDHPLTDILVPGWDVYSPLAARLVREIAELADEKTLRELGDLLWMRYDESNRPNVPELERYLTELRDSLAAEALRRGHEAKSE